MNNKSQAMENRKKDYVYPNIEKWMNENEVSVSRLSEITGCARATISKYLTGEQEPKIYFVREILKLTGMPFEVAFERKEEK